MDPHDPKPRERPKPGQNRARGALSNRSGRFEALARAPGEEEADFLEDTEEETLPPLATTVTMDSSRTIISHNDSPDVPFDQSINPYRGCEHGCIYCYARPSHAYLGLSPGLDFETKLFAKPQAAQLLERSLRHPNYRCRALALGSNTDPYQPIERSLTITRQILQVLAAFNHPVTIVTKSALVARDIDILGPMAARGLVQVALSITTQDRALARTLEPRAATPGKRLATIATLTQAGIPCAVFASPMILGLNDHELEGILAAAAERGATAANYILLRLPLEVADLFREWLETHAPLRAKRVLSLMAQARGGQQYNARWDQRMTGTGALADSLRQRYQLACRRLGLNTQQPPLVTTLFHPPARRGDQLSLPL